MKITRDVITDLLPAYLAKEASADTVALVESFLRDDPEFARIVATDWDAAAYQQPPTSLPPDAERRALHRTRRLLRLRALLQGLAIFFTALPCAFTIRDDQLSWTMWRDSPALAVLSLLLGGLGWTALVQLQRRLKTSGL